MNMHDVFDYHMISSGCACPSLIDIHKRVNISNKIITYRHVQVHTLQINNFIKEKKNLANSKTICELTQLLFQKIFVVSSKDGVKLL